MTDTSSTTRSYVMDYAALEGRVVQEGHTQVCEERGHATHTIAGRLQPVCPRCGEFRETEPAEMTTPDLVRAFAASRVLDATVTMSSWEHRRHLAVVAALRARGVLDDR